MRGPIRQSAKRMDSIEQMCVYHNQKPKKQKTKCIEIGYYLHCLQYDEESSVVNVVMYMLLSKILKKRKKTFRIVLKRENFYNFIVLFHRKTK